MLILIAYCSVRLVVVDSLMKLFRTDFSGRGELAERQQKLGGCLRFLQKLADDHQLAVVITNEVIANVNGLPFEPKMNPAGGNVLAHMVTTR
jgi:DNA repair protein RAD51